MSAVVNEAPSLIYVVCFWSVPNLLPFDHHRPMAKRQDWLREVCCKPVPLGVQLSTYRCANLSVKYMNSTFLEIHSGVKSAYADLTHRPSQNYYSSRHSKLLPRRILLGVTVACTDFGRSDFHTHTHTHVGQGETTMKKTLETTRLEGGFKRGGRIRVAVCKRRGRIRAAECKRGGRTTVAVCKRGGRIRVRSVKKEEESVAECKRRGRISGGV